jgi:hypothetical protein
MKTIGAFSGQGRMTIWAKITLSPFTSIHYFKNVCRNHNVEVLEVQELGGLIFKKYRVRLHGTPNSLQRVSQY